VHVFVLGEFWDFTLICEEKLKWGELKLVVFGIWAVFSRGDGGGGGTTSV
jgi:hypothetical protein